MGSYIPQHEEYYYKVVNLADNSTTVSSTPAVLKAVYVNTDTSAHACPIEDNSGMVFTLQASLCAGTKIDFENTRFETDLVVNPDDSATGNITVTYRPLRNIT